MKDYPNMPKKYLKFTKKNKTFWMWFNVIGFAVQGILCYTTIYMLQSNPIDCSGIRAALWGLFIFHTITAL